MNSFLIATFCSGLTMVPGNVCTTTSDAMFRQVGLHDHVEMMQNFATQKVRSYTPKPVETVAIYSAAAYKFSQGGEARIGFKVPDLCDRLEVGGSRTIQSISLKWNF